MRKCLEKDRERRYQSARELLIDLRNLKRESDSLVAAAEKTDPATEAFASNSPSRLWADNPDSGRPWRFILE